jgi:hypothetical protein
MLLFLDIFLNKPFVLQYLLQNLFWGEAEISHKALTQVLIGTLIHPQGPNILY